MNRWFVACLVFSSLGFFASQPRPANAAEQAAASSLAGARPNIVLVMTDDQGYGEISALGAPVLKTPSLDRLYEQSTRFTDFHVSPTCAPTRAAMMSGRHEFACGVTHTIYERERMSLDTKTMPQMLQRAGYTTGIFGKWHLGDEAEYQPEKCGFDEVFIHGGGGIGQQYPGSCADAPTNRENRYFDPVIRHNGTFVKTKGFCTDVFFAEALGWIREQSKTDAPFFAYISTNAPHDPMISAQHDKQPYLDLGWDDTTAARWGMIADIDENMGLLMQKLDEWQVADNTLLIFMTDNGQSHRRGKLRGKAVALYAGDLRDGKGSPHEGGTRVPALWRWPGKLPAGQDIDALTAHIDLYRTFADLAGGDVPTQQVVGRTMLPLLEKGAAADWPDRYLFTHVGRWKPGEDRQDYQHKRCAVRTSRFRLVNHRMLFDIQNDPGEKTNVFDKHPEVVAKMQTEYDAWWQSVQQGMVNEEASLEKEWPYHIWYNEQLKNEGIPDWTPPEI